jgi:hypothetical protein
MVYIAEHEETYQEIRAKIEEFDLDVLEQKLKDPIWRISNLYCIVDRDGHQIPFVPNPPQQKVLEDLFIHGYRRQIILKARQIGFSTLIEIILLDQVVFNDTLQASLVADTADNAKKLLEVKVKYAYDRVLPDFKKGAGDIKKNESVLRLENGSSVTAGTRQRSGTNQVLHVSEWGKIAHTDPGRSREIKTGALPTVPASGIIFIESTFEGGKGGDFYVLIKEAMETKPSDMTDLDFYFQFFPWFDEESYTLEGNYDQIEQEYLDYFEELEREDDIYLTKGQKLWYYKTARKLGDDMKREHPSTPEEAFNVPVHGAIYGPVISKIRAKRQIIDFEEDEAYPIHTFWDIGLDDYVAVWWIQIVGPWIYVLDHFRGHDLSAEEMAPLVKKRGWNVGKHYLPHDAGARSKNDKQTYESTLKAAGLANTVVLPRIGRKWDGINATKQLVKKMFFHKTRCATDRTLMGEEIPSGVTALENYHRLWIDAAGMWHHEPVHDWSSHDADALRTFGEAYRQGLVDPNEMPSEHSKKRRKTQAVSAYDRKRTRRDRGRSVRRGR